MQRATSSMSDISAQTASRGCGSTKLWRDAGRPVGLLELADRDVDRRARPLRARGGGRWRRRMRARGVVAARRPGRRSPQAVVGQRPTGPGAGPSQLRGGLGPGLRRDDAGARSRHHALDGVDDAHVAGAAAQVAAHLGADLGAREAALAAHEVARGDQHAGRAVAALQGVRLVKAWRMRRHQRIVVEALDGAHVGAVAGHRVGDAGAGDLAVDLDRAGAADAVLAADVGAGEQQLLAQEVGEVRARRRPPRRPALPLTVRAMRSWRARASTRRAADGDGAQLEIVGVAGEARRHESALDVGGIRRYRLRSSQPLRSRSGRRSPCSRPAERRRGRDRRRRRRWRRRTRRSCGRSCGSRSALRARASECARRPAARPRRARFPWRRARSPQRRRGGCRPRTGDHHLGAERGEAGRASRRRGRHGPGCRRWCRACARRDRRCRGRRARESRRSGSGMRPSSIAACVTVAPMVTLSPSSLHRRQLGDARDVDEQRRLGEAQVEHRAERLAAGQHLGTGRCRRASPRPRATVCRPRVVESDGLHAASAFAAGAPPPRIASTMRRGVIGRDQQLDAEALAAHR